jgi:hypothetical protein
VPHEDRQSTASDKSHPAFGHPPDRFGRERRVISNANQLRQLSFPSRLSGRWRGEAVTEGVEGVKLETRLPGEVLENQRIALVILNAVKYPGKEFEPLDSSLRSE